jgi:hypothetical protein
MMRTRLNARGPVVVVGVVMAMAIAGGCNGDDAGGGGVAGGAVSTPAEAPATTDRARPESTTTSAPAVTTTDIVAVPEEGVPGIDSADPFCRAWSQFAGSFQALAFASAAGSEPSAALRLEVVAAAAVVSAALELDAAFPESIASERIVFVDGVVGPFARRAARAVDELRTAGLTEVQLDVLGDAWLVALTESGVDDPAIVVTLPADLEAPVGGATAELSATVPPIASDPSLITQVETPATFDYLAQRCPDQGTLAGNDAVD